MTENLTDSEREFMLKLLDLAFSRGLVTGDLNGIERAVQMARSIQRKLMDGQVIGEITVAQLNEAVSNGMPGFAEV